MNAITRLTCNDISETTYGVIVTRASSRILYPWDRVSYVVYEPEPATEVPSEAKPAKKKASK